MREKKKATHTDIAALGERSSAVPLMLQWEKALKIMELESLQGASIADFGLGDPGSNPGGSYFFLIFSHFCQTQLIF